MGRKDMSNFSVCQPQLIYILKKFWTSLMGHLCKKVYCNLFFCFVLLPIGYLSICLGWRELVWHGNMPSGGLWNRNTKKNEFLPSNRYNNELHSHTEEFYKLNNYRIKVRKKCCIQHNSTLYIKTRHRQYTS